MRTFFIFACLNLIISDCIGQERPSPNKSLSEILKLSFEIELERKDLNIYDKKPLLSNGILIEHFDNSFVFDLTSKESLYFNKIDDRNRIKSKLKDSLVFYDLMNLVVVKNIYTGEIVYKRTKQRGYQIENKQPVLINADSILFKEKNNVLTCVRITNKLTIWQKEFPEMIYAFSEYHSGVINLTTKTTFYQLSKSTGEIIWSIQLIDDGVSNLNSGLNIYGEKAYLWCESKGLIVLDLSARAVEANWWVGGKTARFTMQMGFDGDSVVAKTPSQVFCFDRVSGEVKWVCDNLEIRSDLSFSSDFIFFYQRGKGSADVLSAISRSSHNVEFAGFTSEKFPPFDVENGIYENHLDLTKIDFITHVQGDSLLIGRDRLKIYGFEIVR